MNGGIYTYFHIQYISYTCITIATTTQHQIPIAVRRKKDFKKGKMKTLKKLNEKLKKSSKLEG